MTWRSLSTIPVFCRMLALSAIGHAAAFTVGQGWVRAPAVTVQSGPSSLEVVLVRETPPPVVTEEPIIALTAPETPAPAVRQPQPAPPERSPQEAAPELPGALVEAQPLAAHNPAPEYPQLARERGWEGMVLLRVTVSAAGHPQQIVVVHSSGYQLLDEAAVRAVRRWVFQPARLGFVVLASTVEIPITFVLVKETHP